jgi:hypothetical protein
MNLEQTVSYDTEILSVASKKAITINDEKHTASLNQKIKIK